MRALAFHFLLEVTSLLLHWIVCYPPDISPKEFPILLYQNTKQQGPYTKRYTVLFAKKKLHGLGNTSQALYMLNTLVYILKLEYELE